MNSDTPLIRWRTVGAASVGGLGLVIFAVTVLDVVTDVVAPSETVATTAVENIPPLVLSLGLVWVGHWLLTNATDRRYIYTVVRWTGVVFAGALLTAGWVAAFRRIQGTVEPIFLLADILAVVALAGAVVGLYDAERTNTQEALREERDRHDALVRSLADAVAEIEVTDGGDVRLVETNRKYDELFPDQTEPLPADVAEEAATTRPGGRTVPADGGIIERRVTRPTTDGDRTFNLRSVPIERTNGSQRRYVVYSDQSESVAAERRIATLEDEVDAFSVLQGIATDGDRRMPTRLQDLLAATRRSIDADAGVLCKPGVDPDSPGARTFEVVAATDDAPLAVGDDVPEHDLLRRLESGRVQRLPSDDAALPDDPAHGDAADTAPFAEYRAFVGGEVHADGDLYGVSCFATAAGDGFDESDETVVRQANEFLGSVVDRWQTTQELRDRRERLDVVASTVSHDFQTPLSIVVGNAAEARDAVEALDDDPDDDLWQCLDHLETGAERLDELADEVTRIAREGRDVQNIEVVDVAATAREAWKTTDTADAALDVSDDAGTVRADPSRIKRVFENLYRNAVEHGGRDVTVTVRPRDEGDGFVVADDGDGFPDDLDPGDALDRYRSRSNGGSGLGLWLVDVIASAHGWRIHATDGEDGGARFEIRTDGAQADDGDAPR